MVRRLVERDQRLWLSRSWTTREPRPGESSKDYTFVDRETFEDRIRAGGFLEWASFLGHYYGTPLPEVPEGSDVVLEIDVQGAAQVRKAFPEAVVILVVAPTKADQEARLRARGDGEDHVRSRVELAELEEADGRRLADHVVVNDDLDQAVSDLASIVQSHRGQPPGAVRPDLGER